jgi:4'-phosphopantetheinyl transferase
MDTRWTIPVDTALVAGDVHLWRIALDARGPALDEPVLLSKTEQERARQFAFDRDRRRYTVAHTALREILARHYLGVEMEEVEFSHGRGGKPDVMNDRGLQFNLSHSGELALIGVTRSRRIGVDVEARRLVVDAEQIAARNFSAREYQELRALPPSQRLEGFFNAWTRKEAFVKATGDGLSCALAGFDVSLAPGSPAELRCVHGVPDEASRWSLQALAPGTHYVAALAVEGQLRRLLCFTWPRQCSDARESAVAECA